MPVSNPDCLVVVQGLCEEMLLSRAVWMLSGAQDLFADRRADLMR